MKSHGSILIPWRIEDGLQCSQYIPARPLKASCSRIFNHSSASSQLPGTVLEAFEGDSLMLPPNLETPREVTLHYNNIYEDLIKSGEALPFLYPWAAAGAFAVIGYLLIDHRQHRWTRHIVYGLLVAFQIWCIRTTRAVHPAAAFGVGLLSGWGLLWVFAVMVARDCQKDFVRLQRRDKDASMNGSTANGNAAKADGGLQTKFDELYWQSYPSKLADRIDWIADVFCSFRGVGWNFQVSGVPRLPKQIEAQIHSNIDAPEAPETMTTSRTGIRRIADRNLLFRNCLRDLVIGYFILDIIKTLMSRDRYFIGYTDAAAPTYLPLVIQHSHFLTKGYRLLTSLAGVYFALREIFTLGPLFFCYIVGPKYIGLRGETWMNPVDMFGNFSNILDNGLAGWWGGWWHQAFRYGFQAPTDRLLEALDMEKKSQEGKLVGMFVAFTLSGCLHACGSYTQLGETSPMGGPFLFFFLQPFGIIAQLAGAYGLKQVGVSPRLPKAIRQAANFALVHAWLYYTAPLLMDDFAKGGVWLYEPLAFSPLRGFGFGATDDTFFCWWNGIAFWRTGRTWWDTGIAF